MSGRHQPSNGADAVDDRGATDYICQNAHTVYSGHLFTYNGRSLCRECAVRESGEPACDWCERPTFGDYRQVRIRKVDVLSIVCGVCIAKNDERYEAATA